MKWLVKPVKSVWSIPAGAADEHVIAVPGSGGFSFLFMQKQKAYKALTKEQERFWKRILIVDDNTDITTTFKAAIEDSNSGNGLKDAYVDSLMKNGPADKAGIHGSTTDQYSKKHLGDVIIGADGHNVTTSDDLVNYIGQHKSAGDNITLTVYRNGQTIVLKTTLAARLSLVPFLTTGSVIPSIPHPPIRPPTIPHP